MWRQDQVSLCFGTFHDSRHLELGVCRKGQPAGTLNHDYGADDRTRIDTARLALEFTLKRAPQRLGSTGTRQEIRALDP